MAWEYQQHRRRQELRYNTKNAENRIFYACVPPDTGVEEVPTSATIAVDNPAGTAILTATAMTAAGSPSPLLTYDLDTTTVATWPLGEGYRADIVVTRADASTYHDSIWLDIVRRPLIFTLTDDQLVAVESELGEVLEQGTTDYRRKILHTADEIRARLRVSENQHGHLRPALVVGAAQLERWHLYLTLTAIFRDRLGEGEGMERKAEQYSGLAKEWQDLTLGNLAYDRGDSEDPDVDLVRDYSAVRLVP